MAGKDGAQDHPSSAHSHVAATHHERGKLNMLQGAATGIGKNCMKQQDLGPGRRSQRVDEETHDYERPHAGGGAERADERVLVCVIELPGGPALIRDAKIIADRLHAPWAAAIVDRGRQERLGSGAVDRVTEMMRLAAELGGKTLTLPGSHIADEIIDYARANNITQIILGRSARSRWHELLHRRKRLLICTSVPYI